MTKKLLVCDLDNTLYDWVGYFVPAFYSMIDEAVRIIGCDRERLLDDFRAVHQLHRDLEHPFSLLETETVQKAYFGLSRNEIARRLDPAFHAFNASRKENLRLYPDVVSTLENLLQSDFILVAHTESNLYAVVDRLTRLDLTEKFSRIYCRERARSEHPNPSSAVSSLSNFPLSWVTELSHHQRKPNPEVLLEICNDERIPPEQTAYVGDSLARDILMAKMAGVYSIWAKYGVVHQSEQYQKLVRITHWTPDDVARENKLRERAQEIKPDYILENTFSDIVYPLLQIERRQFAAP